VLEPQGQGLQGAALGGAQAPETRDLDAGKERWVSQTPAGIWASAGWMALYLLAVIVMPRWVRAVSYFMTELKALAGKYWQVEGPQVQVLQAPQRDRSGCKASRAVVTEIGSNWLNLQNDSKPAEIGCTCCYFTQVGTRPICLQQWESGVRLDVH
jgi:hypothetical protein